VRTSLPHVELNAHVAPVTLRRSHCGRSTRLRRPRPVDQAPLQACGSCLGSHDLTATVALIDGLNTAVCAPVRPLPPAQALQILLAHVEGDLAVAAS
jgi:hypothetical protein